MSDKAQKNLPVISIDAYKASRAKLSIDGKSDATYGGGRPPGDDDMEARVRKLEDTVTRIDATLPHLATKADLVREISGVRGEIKDLKSSLVQWFVATAVGLTVLVAAISRYMPPAS